MILVYFLASGTAAYVLPRFTNKIYIMVEKGDTFGHVELAIEKDMNNIEIRIEPRFLKRKNIIRRFTVQAIENCEMFILRIEDIEKMRMEFPDVYSELFDGVHERLKKELLLKLDVIIKCENA